MAEESQESTQKRSRPDLEKEDKTPENSKKRCRTDTESKYTNFIPTSKRSPHQFWALHLQILQSLYTETIDGLGNDAHEDGPVPQTLWDTIRKYLQSRGRVQGLSSQASHYRGLHEEAINFIQDENEQINNPATMTPRSNQFRQGLSNRSDKRSGLSLFGSQLHSPYHPTTNLFSTSLSWTEEEPNSVGSFGLVAEMLMEKFTDATEQLQESSTPFHPLLEQVETRIQRLEAVVTTVGLTNPPRSVPERVDGGGDRRLGTGLPDSEEAKAQVDIKLRLWKTLRADLQCNSCSDLS